ncbi:hypothetical protein AAMO2058_001512800 [Amorphochlora amoebiformis]|mmetsp:Transcript_17745/g.28305  ORF Transcript_17745/g.28305 Transcript_17745/m.28305 type:complete len:377 (-) Transcript_17745:143-1273(-)
MGGLCSQLGEEDEVDRKIQRELALESEESEQIHKLLLLGAGQSGKSTFFKQTISIYGCGFSAKERMVYVPIIYGNTIRAMKELIKQSELRSNYIPTEEEFKESQFDPSMFRIAPELKEARDEVINAKRDKDALYRLTPKLAGYIALLWQDMGIRSTYERRNEFQLDDTSSYFFDQVVDLADANFVPSEEQMLRARVRTTGVSETTFTIEKTQFRMVDVGGQRSERKKWIKCFQNVTCVIFVAAISTYNQVLFEDDETNRIIEALNLFEETCNSSWFDKTSIILFLNKKDLFQEKIQRYPITECPAFADYDGPLDSFSKSIEFIVKVFLECNKRPDKCIYPHATCATDRSNVRHVFVAVKDTVLKENLKIAGLMLTA